ncbi:hypothetical protein BD289DRAFT_89729 [Coniella lustricola]|uniref:Uncharacterized protein n=1 Tax=Coniella lustricola TaxID=2025994 RepID=A0A2T3AH36_9PEZI|nr:hypothetical protein BD289DRAFT_89729 [Coniella lustricola]
MTSHNSTRASCEGSFVCWEAEVGERKQDSKNSRKRSSAHDQRRGQTKGRSDWAEGLSRCNPMLGKSPLTIVTWTALWLSLSLDIVVENASQPANEGVGSGARSVVKEQCSEQGAFLE